MNRRRLLGLQVGLAVALLALIVGSLVISRAQEPTNEPSAKTLRKVVVFTVPGLGLEDLDADLMPQLDVMARHGSIAVANVRIQNDEPNLVGAYASLGAGNRLKGSDVAPIVVAGSTPLPNGQTVGDAMAAAAGGPARGDVVVPNLADVTAQVRADGGSQVGALADAVEGANKRVAIVADPATGSGPGPVIPAGVAATDRDGFIGAGDVSADLVTTRVSDDGVEQRVADPAAFARAVRAAQARADLVIVDAGETTRAATAAQAERDAEDTESEAATTTTSTAGPTSTTSTTVPAKVEAARDRRAALARTDAVLGRVRQSLRPDTLLLVVGVTPPDGGGWALTPMVAWGPGIPHGYLDSSSTHRPALVTLTDVAPTILDTLDVAVPEPMIGQPLRYRAADSSWSEARQLDDLLKNRVSVDSTMTVLFIVAQSVIYGLVALLLLTRGLPRRLRPWFEVGALACGAWPVATYLLRIGTSLYSMGTTSIVLSWAIACALAVVARFGFRRHRLDPVLAIGATTILVLVVDLATGAHLQVGSFFGYMPHTAPRFVGLGNSGFAILAGATVAVMAALVIRARDREPAWWIAAALAAAVVIADGAPWMGTDVGGILALVPVLGLFLWALRGHRIRWQTLLLAVVAGAAALALAVGVEALRAPDQRTHIGRFFLNAGEGSTFTDTLRRKWDTNVADLRRNPFVWFVPVLAVAGVVIGRRAPSVRRVLPPRSVERAAVIATLAAGTAGWLVNDSGIIVLALTCVMLGPFIVLLAVADRTTAAPLASASAGTVAEPVAPTDAGDPATGDLVPADHPEVEAEASDADEPERRVSPTVVAPSLVPGRASTVTASMTPTASADDAARDEDRPPRVVALVPAKDRGDSVADTVAALLAIDRIDQVLVIDDGSGDDTADRAAAAGADVLVLARNQGKGGAVLAGARHTPDADVYLLIDADLARTASAALALLEPVLAGDADLTIGVLPSAGGKGGFGTIRKLSAAAIHRATGLTVAAPLSGQRAIRAELLRDLRDAERFGLEVAMTIDVARAGGRVLELDVPMDHRHTGRSVSGFAHRGRQGVDIVRSLWPRLVGRPIRWALLAVVVLAAVLAGYLSANRAAPSGHAPTRPADKVLIVGIAGWGLDDIDPATMPHVAALADQGALGLATPRTAGIRTPVNAYATIGAGDRIGSANATPPVVDADTEMQGSTAREVTRRGTGRPATGAIVLPTMGQLSSARSADGSSTLGALGDALHRGGRRTAVVANSSTGLPVDDVIAESLGMTTPTRWSAPAALAVTGSDGSIDGGEVGNVLLRSDPERPFGVTADPDRFVAAVTKAFETADVVALDTGDMDRLIQYRTLLSSKVSSAARTAAITATDKIIGDTVAALPPNTLVIVVGVTPPKNDPLVPLVISGPGWEGGRFTSPSTRRPDLATITDLAPTVLAAFDLPTPRGMVGHALRWMPGSPDRGALTHQQDLIRARDAGYQPLVDAFVWGSVLLFAVVAAVLWRQRRGDRPQLVDRLRPLLRWAVVALAAWPTATFVVRALGPLYHQGATSETLVWLLAGVGGWAALRLRRHPLDPLLAVAAFSWTLTTIDLMTGANLQVSSYLGYTPSVAARFVGMGNAAFGVYAASAVVVCALVVARAPRRAGPWSVAAAVAAISVVSDGAPWLGADVGGILTLVPVLGLVLWQLSGHRPTWKVVGGAAVATVAALGAAVGIEALRPPQDRTHIGRFFLGSDGGGFWSTIERKWSVNVMLLSSSTWSYLIWGGLAFSFVVLVLNRGWARSFATDRPERVGLLGLFAVALLGWASNDSGPLVAALVFSMIGAYVALTELDDRVPAERLLVAAPVPTTATATDTGAGGGAARDDEEDRP